METTLAAAIAAYPVWVFALIDCHMMLSHACGVQNASASIDRVDQLRWLATGTRMRGVP